MADKILWRSEAAVTRTEGSTASEFKAAVCVSPKARALQARNGRDARMVPASSGRPLEEVSCAPGTLTPLTFIGALATVTVLCPTLQDHWRLGGVAAAVRWRLSRRAGRAAGW
jgi:hypothetical protein